MSTVTVAYVVSIPVVIVSAMSLVMISSDLVHRGAVSYAAGNGIVSSCTFGPPSDECEDNMQAKTRALLRWRQRCTVRLCRGAMRVAAKGQQRYNVQ